MPHPPFIFLLMLFKFGNDIVITFEMPGVAYSMSFDKIYISLQFRPSVIRGPCISACNKDGFSLLKIVSVCILSSKLGARCYFIILGPSLVPILNLYIA